MTRILYIPTGDCLKFLKMRGVTDEIAYTEVYEASLMSYSGKTPIEFIHYMLNTKHELPFKNRNNIPIHGKVFIEEFEIMR